MRLDLAMVAWGLVASRARAKDLIDRGLVTLWDQAMVKPNKTVGEDDRKGLVVNDFGWVSRSALKLVGALDHFYPDGGKAVLGGKSALDIGASTGGFCEVLLDRGAAHVVALDVGHGQLHPCLVARGSQVLNLEGKNARDLVQSDLPCQPEIIVSDVSFISLTLAMPPAMAVAAPGALLFALIKPQFEIGKGQLGKGGIVRDPLVRDAVVLELVEWFESRPGWRVVGRIDSPLEGPDGNREAIVHAIKDA